MNNNKLILIIAISFSLLVNFPRIVFLLGNSDPTVDSLLEISLSDTIFRFLMLFTFCLIILKLHLNWVQIFAIKWRIFIATSISFLILIIWISTFRIIENSILKEVSTTINPRFNAFVYFFVMLMLLVISRAIALSNQSKLDAIEKERLKQQSLYNELTALKNQINPHFLFNSLNSLNLLVRQDQNAAGKFINKLSFLYRYILQSKDQDLVTVKEELKFLESYIYLIKQRYQNKFNANIQIDKSVYSKKIPALALQLLVENVVKHNEISQKHPLTVSIFQDNAFIVVKNKLQKRTDSVESTHIGLSNLNKRFNLLLNKDIIIEKNSHFIVKIPIS